MNGPNGKIMRQSDECAPVCALAAPLKSAGNLQACLLICPLHRIARAATTKRRIQDGFCRTMNEQELRKKLELLRTEHRDLDAAIAALTEAARGNASADQLQIARLKKRKLRLKDQIAIIEDTLLPDIIA
jgi:hypothetical protein